MEELLTEISRHKRPAAFYIKRSIGLILLLAMSATFLFSAYSKIDGENAFDNFQWTFIDLGISNIVAAGIVARLMIGLEITLALFLLAHIFLRSFTYKAIIALLTIFIAYLLIIILKQGNNGNCGCFGERLSMTPAEAIIKNVVMIVVTVILMYVYPVSPYKNQPYVAMVLALVACSTPFLMHNIYIGTAPVPDTRAVNLDLLYKYEPKPEVDLRKGKHIIAFMSLTCPHCKKAARLLQIIHRQYPSLPVYMVLDGADAHKKAFFEETQSESVPHIFYQHTEEFTDMAGDGVPAIYWMDNGKVKYKSKYAYYQLNPAFMISWVGNNN